MTSRMKRSQGNPSPAQSEIMARLAAAASGNSQALAVIETLRFSMTGVVIDRDLNKDEWLTLIQNTRRIRQAYRWMIGDLMVYGVKKSFQGAGDFYDEIAPLTGYTSDALKNIASVCRSVENSRRRENLTFAHHEVVTKLPPEEQTEWLDKAIAGKWKRDRLRAEIAKAQLPASAPTGDVTDWSEGMPEGVTVELIGTYPAPPDEIDDIETEPLPLEHEENARALGHLEDVVKHRKYTALTPRQKTIIRREINTVRQMLGLLEAELRKK